MKTKNRKIVAALCLIMMIPCFALPTSANSRAQEWYGTDANGVVFKEGNVPIEVESELLTFDIPTLPYAEYRDAESFLTYDSKVTAEYTFYNPTDMTITATLLFPFGTYPEYAKLTDAKTGEKLYAEDLARYGVTINGEKIDAKVRHTTILDYGNFDTDKHIAMIQDDFIEDDFYHPELTVTKYSYEIVGHELPSAFFNINVQNLGTERRIVIYNGNCGGGISKDGGVSITNLTADKNKKETVYFYVFGAPLTEAPEACWYKNNGSKPASKTDGKFSYLGSESMTLSDFIFDARDESRGISDVDWYNACVTRLKESEETNGSTCAVTHLSLSAGMRWFEYKITLKPGEKIKNTVTAPMYPDIEAWNQPYKYHYTYLLSPASGWADFGRLDIVVNTPYEMISSSVEGFEKTDSGYKLSRDGLPTNEEGHIDLYFSLESDGSVAKEQPNPNRFLAAVESILSFIGSLFVISFILIVEFIASIFH